jgi:hypothetical protein
MQELGERFPHVRLVLGKNLGFDDMLVDLVERRIAESGDCLDVREVELPPRQKYPIPPGQHEFVPMLPDEAREFLDKRSNGEGEVL